MRKGKELEDLFLSFMKQKAKTIKDVREDKNYQAKKVDFILEGLGTIDVKNDTHFGSTGNLFVEWEYLFLRSHTIHRCWGHPECEHHAEYFVFYKKGTDEFCFYKAEDYMRGFWQALEDKKVRIGIEHSDDKKSTIYFLFPEKYDNPVEVMGLMKKQPAAKDEWDEECPW